MKRLFIFAGEHSGDLHGSHLIKALKTCEPDIEIMGVAGPKMRIQGIEEVMSMEKFEVMGFSDVICALPRLYRQFYKIRDYILSTKPDGVVLIDYPGFNLRLAQNLRKEGFKGKIIHYVAPTVWAWGKHRIDMMAETLDLLLTIYPFESEYFAHSPLKTVYVGNPLCEYLKDYSYDDQWRQKLGIPRDSPMISLFPGSRPSEIARNLPLIFEAAALYKQRHPETIFALSGSHALSLVQKELRESIYTVPRNYTYELMRDSLSSIAKSGTVTLELALHQRPAVVVYKLTMLNRLYAKYILKLNLPHYCIVNILAKHNVFPELIQSDLSAENIAQHLMKLNGDKNLQNKCINSCQEISRLLGGINSSVKAAESILQVIE